MSELVQGAEGRAQGAGVVRSDYAARSALCALILFLIYGCASSSAPTVSREPVVLRGVASWYGEEFAGRTTANGEIFDPLLLTAAHRTLPFGTIADIVNPQTGQKVRVRVNDRGPYIGNRIIDLSYAAAQQIGLIEPGIGEVEIAIVTVGKGEREPPAPFAVTIAPIAPAPAPGRQAAPPPQIAPTPIPEAVVDRVEVQEQRGDVVTRKQVAADGRTLENVPVEDAGAAAATERPVRPAAAVAAPAPPVRRATPQPAATKQFVVQVGAFSVEANAKALQQRLVAIGHRAWIDRESLYRVRLGPFATRDEAAEARESLEATGISAIILSE